MDRWQDRRRFMATAAMGCLAPVALAQTRYPDRPVTLVVPASVGGSPDTMARLLAQRMQASLGQPVLVDTVPGASGLIGIQKVLNNPADGYTALYGFNQLITMNPYLVKGLPYVPERDLAPVSGTADLGYIWIANNDFPPNDVPQWMAYARAHPGKVSFATTGPGSAANLGGEMFMRHTGAQMLAVPYKANSTPDLLGGVIHLKMEPYTTAVPLVTAGKVKALAVTGTERLKVLPDVPTMSEAIKDYVIRGWQAIWVKQGTPQAAIDRLNEAVRAVLAQPELAERMSKVALRPMPTSPGELAQMGQQESAMWRDLIRDRNIQAE
jgi:tripartite-type tricarboxylate transporter receptor subunit TctC